MPADRMTGKTDLRRRFTAWRESRSPEELTAISAAICRRIEELSAYQNAEWVLGYAPFRRETDIRPLLETALAAGKRVALPYCNPATHTMTFYEIRSWADLRPGHYGIAEPPTDYPWQPTASAVCLVPGLAYDENGYRLGYGGGYYDRFLPGFAGVSVGVCPAECRVAVLPQETTDHPVTVVISETKQGGKTYDR